MPGTQQYARKQTQQQKMTEMGRQKYMENIKFTVTNREYAMIEQQK